MKLIQSICQGSLFSRGSLRFAKNGGENRGKVAGPIWFGSDLFHLSNIAESFLEAGRMKATFSKMDLNRFGPLINSNAHDEDIFRHLTRSGYPFSRHMNGGEEADYLKLMKRIMQRHVYAATRFTSLKSVIDSARQAVPALFQNARREPDLSEEVDEFASGRLAVLATDFTLSAAVGEGFVRTDEDRIRFVSGLRRVFVEFRHQGDGDYKIATMYPIVG